MIAGTEGYAADAAGLVERYERIAFVDKHRAVLHFIPPVPCRVLDIGAGTGADAAWLADRGHRVVAVEPVDGLRVPGMTRHPSALIEWVNDSLPHLAVMAKRAEPFDVVMMTAVWMHLDEGERRQAMPTVASFIRPGGVLLMSLRHGPPSRSRRMFHVPVEETVQLAHTYGLRSIAVVRAESVQAVNRQAGVTWSHLAFERAG